MKEGELSLSYGHIYWGHLALREQFTPSGFQESTILKSKNPALSEPSVVSFRIYLAGRDGGNNRGILGCRFIPDQQDKTIVKVGVLDYEPLYFRLEPGLTTELAEVVLEQAVKEVEQSVSLGAGTLIFDIGMNSAVHSGPRIFRLLTRVVLKLLDSRIDWTKESATDFVKNEIHLMTTQAY